MLRRLRGLLRKPSRALIGKHRTTRQLTHEALEDRCLLANGPLISEFMAVNDSTLADEDGEFSDWIEIHNPTDAAVDLTGWHLTDDVTELDKWTISSLSLDPGEFQVVFASGKDRTNPISELHTNFSLAASGEYLALVRPDLTPAHAYAPAYPQQEPDLSYGVIFDVFQFISEGAPVEVHVPQDSSLGMTWTDPFFTVDEESWIDGATGVGFGLSVPGFTVDYFKANISVGSLGVAESVIANTSQQSSTATEIAPVINYLNTNSGAHYGGNAPFPTLAIGNDVNDFVIEATGTVIIPSAGQWTFGVNSDDGFSLDLDNGTNSFSMSYPNPRAPGDTLSTFNITQPGPYDLRLVMYERGGGAEVEMYAAQGSYGSWNGTNFDLVGDTGSGGLEVFTSPNGGSGGSTTRLST